MTNKAGKKNKKASGGGAGASSSSANGPTTSSRSQNQRPPRTVRPSKVVLDDTKRALILNLIKRCMRARGEPMPSGEKRKKQKGGLPQSQPQAQPSAAIATASSSSNSLLDMLEGDDCRNGRMSKQEAKAKQKEEERANRRLMRQLYRDAEKWAGSQLITREPIQPPPGALAGLASTTTGERQVTGKNTALGSSSSTSSRPVVNLGTTTQILSGTTDGGVIYQRLQEAVRLRLSCSTGDRTLKAAAAVGVKTVVWKRSDGVQALAEAARKKFSVRVKTLFPYLSDNSVLLTDDGLMQVPDDSAIVFHSVAKTSGPGLSGTKPGLTKQELKAGATQNIKTATTSTSTTASPPGKNHDVFNATPSTAPPSSDLLENNSSDEEEDDGPIETEVDKLRKRDEKLRANLRRHGNFEHGFGQDWAPHSGNNYEEGGDEPDLYNRNYEKFKWINEELLYRHEEAKRVRRRFEETQTLPAHLKRQEIMAAINASDSRGLAEDVHEQQSARDGQRHQSSASTSPCSRVVLVAGATGSGKTTQVPQFVLEDFCEQLKEQDDLGSTPPLNVICCQPRRIAAMGVADRAAAERGEQCGETVGYAVRGDSKCHPRKTRVLFCTTGVVLQKLTSSPFLHDVSHLIIDEVHERSLHIDFLLTLLRKVILVKNKKIKVILMSATVDTKLFEDYFSSSFQPHNDFSVQLVNSTGGSSTAPLRMTSKKMATVSIEGRTFPVQTIWQREIGRVAQECRDCQTNPALSRNSHGAATSVFQNPLKQPGGTNGKNNFQPFPRPKLSPEVQKSGNRKDGGAVTAEMAAQIADIIEALAENYRNQLENRSLVTRDQIQRPGILIFAPGAFEIDFLVRELTDCRTLRHLQKPCDRGRTVARLADEVSGTRAGSSGKVTPHQLQYGGLQFLPLHAQVEPRKQRYVFDTASPSDPQPAIRVIVATNIAETSITVADVTDVIDTGMLNEARYEHAKQMKSLTCVYVSQAMAKQRGGRAGRVCPGRNWRLYDEKFHDEKLPPHSLPEMQRTQLEDLVLHLAQLLPPLGSSTSPRTSTGAIKTSNSAPGRAPQAAAAARGHQLHNEEDSRRAEERFVSQEYDFTVDDIPSFLQNAPEPPEHEAVQAAQSRLIQLGALDVIENDRKEIVPKINVDRSDVLKTSYGTSKNDKGKPTGAAPPSTSSPTTGGVLAAPDLLFLSPLGFHLQDLPLEPQIGKLLLMACILGASSNGLTLAASLSLGKTPFRKLWMPQEKNIEDLQGQLFGFRKTGENSDHLALCRAYDEWVERYEEHGYSEAANFCHHYGLNPNVLNDIWNLRNTLTGKLKDIGFSDTLPDARRLENRGSAPKQIAQAGKEAEFASLMTLCAVTAAFFPQVAQVQRDSKFGGARRGGKSSHMRTEMAIVPIELVEQQKLGHHAAGGVHPLNSKNIINAGDQQEQQNKNNTNACTATIHPSSFNRQADRLDANHSWLLYYKMMHTSKLYLFDTSCVTSTILLLFGSAKLRATVKREKEPVRLTSLTAGGGAAVPPGSSTVLSATTSRTSSKKRKNDTIMTYLGNSLVLGQHCLCKFDCSDPETVLLIRFLRKEIEELLIKRVDASHDKRANEMNYVQSYDNSNKKRELANLEDMVQHGIYELIHGAIDDNDETDEDDAESDNA
ncbi:unnamed protein product [Amoebophrya sp. A120]|nr:unnamed protein product [Amoebophrya sp. A120]|eukprot:GSA120T00006095001.1